MSKLFENSATKKVYFCGKCMTQIRCKGCDDFLEVDDVGCTTCGTPKEQKQTQEPSLINSNTFKLHETSTDRTIEASFSDVVGKDLAGILRDFSLNAKTKSIGAFDTDVQNQNDLKRIEETIDADFSISDENPLSNDSSEKVEPQNKQTNEYPSLIAIAMKNLPSSETEWIVVYSFYASNFGQDIFDREKIIQNYIESNRFKKDSTRKEVSTIIKRAVQAGYINPLQTGYSILDKGTEKAKEIIARTASSTPRIRSVSNKNNAGKSEENVATPVKSNSKNKNTLRRITNINFEPEGKESLKSYFLKYSATNDHERNLLFVNYMKNVLDIDAITFDHLYTCYDLLDLRISENLPQTARNTASKKGWIDIKDSKLFITIKGSNELKSWNK